MHRSPSTHTKPPISSQSQTPFAPTSVRHTPVGPPSSLHASAPIVPSSPSVKKARNESGCMPVRYALRYGMYIVPQSTPAPSAAATPRAACAGVACSADASASTTAPANSTSAPPHTPSQRAPPAPRSSPNRSAPHTIPSRPFAFQSGNAIARPTSRIACTVSVFATAQSAPASSAHTTRCGVRSRSARTPAVPRSSAGRLQRARNTPSTIISEIATGGMPSVTSLVGASAAPSHAPAVTPERTPTAWRRERRAASTRATAAARRRRRTRRAGSRSGDPRGASSRRFARRAGHGLGWLENAFGFDHRRNWRARDDADHVRNLVEHEAHVPLRRRGGEQEPRELELSRIEGDADAAGEPLVADDVPRREDLLHAGVVRGVVAGEPLEPGAVETDVGD